MKLRSPKAPPPRDPDTPGPATQPDPAPVLTARAAGLVGCTRCARVWPPDRARCGCCGARLASRERFSLLRVWVWWSLGLIAYLPANLLPMLHTRTLFGTADSTLIGGALDLMRHGAPGVAAIVLLASVAIPIGKLAAIAWLALSVRQGRAAGRRMRLFHAVEFVGRWSMIDIFVVAILSALVQFSVVATIRPGAAALAYALSVAFTMLAARAFDSRMIWDDGTAPPGTRA